MTATMNKVAGKMNFVSENERLLEKLLAAGVQVRSFDGWKSVGKWVKKGEKQKSFRVQNGWYRAGVNVITGEDQYDQKFSTCYGFTADQVR